MTVFIDLQIACTTTKELPSIEQLTHWAEKAVVSANYQHDSEVTIRIVDKNEIHQLNNEYRKQDKTTNVLSFPFEAPLGIELNLLGDLVICADIVLEESKNQHKPIQAHWAHMVIHGIFHLLGYDHMNDKDAAEMETLEIELLDSLGYANPYIYP